MNLYARLSAAFLEHHASVGFSTPDGTEWTWAEVDRRASAYSAALTRAGVNPGDRVLVQIEKSLENVALYLGVLHCGAVFVTLNTAYTAAEVSYFVTDAMPTLVVHDPEAPIVTDAVTWTLDHTGAGSASTAADQIGEAELADPVLRRPEDPAAMLYTSGTTGRSKGAVLSHQALTINAQALHQAWGFGPDDVLLHSLPIFHVHGLFIALHCAMLSGCSVRFLSRFDVGAVLEDLPTATVLMGVPTHYTRLMADDRFCADLTGSIRLFTSGSAPMTEAVHLAFEQRSGQRIVERYGMTEAGIITTNPLDGDRIAGTVGFPLSGWDLRVAGEDGQSVPAGVTGSVQIRGSGLLSEYWQKPDKTAEAYSGDWFITGDVGSLDAHGRLTLEGRNSDMIISGGLNVYPKEVEMVIDDLDGVAESAVVGLPHPDFGEAVVAFVVTESPDRDLLKHTGLGDHVQTRLANFKQPKRWIALDALPRNAMGKVQKSQLRQRYADVFTPSETS